MASMQQPDDSWDSEIIVPELQLRKFSRSPHPYRRKNSRFAENVTPPSENGDIYSRAPAWLRTPRSSSDSGTEADDESTGFLKSLPAPPLRPHKGLRDSGKEDSKLLARPPPWRIFAHSKSRSLRQSSGEESVINATLLRAESTRKRKIEVLRRLAEITLLLFVGVVVFLREDTRLLALSWRRELLTHVLLVLTLYVAYPLRILWRTASKRRSIFRSISSFYISSDFDPAPLLYPIVIPILVSLSLTNHTPTLILPNIILALSSLPADVIPLYEGIYGYSISQWIVTIVPLIMAECPRLHSLSFPSCSVNALDSEILFLTFPLHQSLTATLDFLLTTSLLRAELQLLATALINLFLFSRSPQAEILKALLWFGGISVFILCRSVLEWEVAIARVPTWKFRRAPSNSRTPRNMFSILDHKLCQKLSAVGSTEEQTSDSDVSNGLLRDTQRKAHHAISSAQRNGLRGIRDRQPLSAIDNIKIEDLWPSTWTRPSLKIIHRRRHTISTLTDVEGARSHRVRTTPSGRRKRSMAPGLAPFLSMTAAQARVRKRLYAGYTYMAVLFIIMGPIRKYIGNKALRNEPFGWALGYLLGNLSFVRFWVIILNLEPWVPLPPRTERNEACPFGWVEHLRHDTFGDATTRLLICGYCSLVLSLGMVVVLRLSAIVEVDTRRKVFHGMMVLMFLPIAYVDPAFSALSLALVLATFLLLELFRASQLPPISKPLAYFLAPYIDGRDHRGPVIISHIFLLIGCAVPLWLSMADIPRVTRPPWEAWDLVHRDVSMVSGVVCVGMGDAAASLIGRRFGRLKWFWGGEKSLEGSLAFTISVFVGLLFARVWLQVGGWPTGYPTTYFDNRDLWLAIAVKLILAAGGASATEAVLTGANDNVIVPIVLWLLVRGLGI